MHTTKSEHVDNDSMLLCMHITSTGEKYAFPWSLTTEKKIPISMQFKSHLVDLAEAREPCLNFKAYADGSKEMIVQQINRIRYGSIIA